MASAITKIATATADGTSTVLSFSSIVNTYTDLILKVNVRSGRSSGPVQDSMLMRFNSVSTASYVYEAMFSDGGAAQGDKSTSASSIFCGYVPSSNASANTYSNGEIYITDYASSTHLKCVKFNVSAPHDSTQSYITVGAGRFESNSAIASIDLLTGSGQNWVSGSYATLYGVTKATVGGTGSKATGGTVTTGGGKTYHTFFTSGVFTPTTNITGAEVLVIAGGGGSGPSATGGGGAGGLVYASSQSFTSGTNYTAIVGGGGAPGTSGGVNGSSSVFANGTVAVGGGAGGYPANGSAGGSGGGAHRLNTVGAATAGQGSAGGQGTNSGGSNAGGGGGFSEVGQAVATSGYGGRGGRGTDTYSTFGQYTGTGEVNSGLYYFCGGGGGRSLGDNIGGIGGGGGRNVTPTTFAANGWANTGGGGGGTSENANLGAGGSGVIIVRYTT